MIKASEKFYKGDYFIKKKKNSPLTLNHILDPSFFKCKDPQCQLMWLVHLKEVVFNLCQKRRHNLVHWKYSFDFPFCTKWDLRILRASSYEPGWPGCLGYLMNFALGSYEKFQPGFRDEKRSKILKTSSGAKFGKQSKRGETENFNFRAYLSIGNT